jgi:hypothetical protein
VKLFVGAKRYGSIFELTWYFKALILSKLQNQVVLTSLGNQN